MKTAFTILILILAVLACGCTATTPAVPATPVVPITPIIPGTTAVNAVPNLIGNWTGPMKGYDEGIGFNDYSNLTMNLTVTEQRDRIFTGYLVYKYKSGEQGSTAFAGAIGKDGRTLTMVEKDYGYCFGTILSNNEIELTYMSEATPYSIAIDSFKRI
ncbi:MAG: hypothetical protein WC626_04510 [Methanoregula sp.]